MDCFRPVDVPTLRLSIALLLLGSPAAQAQVSMPANLLNGIVGRANTIPLTSHMPGGGDLRIGSNQHFLRHLDFSQIAVGGAFGTLISPDVIVQATHRSSRVGDRIVFQTAQGPVSRKVVARRALRRDSMLLRLDEPTEFTGYPIFEKNAFKRVQAYDLEVVALDGEGKAFLRNLNSVASTVHHYASHRFRNYTEPIKSSDSGHPLFYALRNGQLVLLGTHSTGLYASSLNQHDLQRVAWELGSRYRLRFISEQDLLGSSLGRPLVFDSLPKMIDEGDCNFDGEINALDLACVANILERDLVLSSLNTLPGDLAGGGGPAFADFIKLAEHFGEAQASYVEGNINLQGGVDFSDFLELARNFRVSSGEVTGVPEPSTAALTWLLALWLLSMRRAFSIRRTRQVNASRG